MLRAILLLLAVLCAAPLFSQKPELSDAEIEVHLRERLAKSVIGQDHFTPRVKGGIVYWEGSTNVAQHKGAATRMAKSAGARKVVNNIKVNPTDKRNTAKPSPPAKAPSAAPAKPAAETLPPGTPAPKRAAVQWVPVRPR